MRWQESAHAVLRSVGVSDADIERLIAEAAFNDDERVDYALPPEMVARFKSFYEKYGLKALWQTLEMVLLVKQEMEERVQQFREEYAQTNEEKRQAVKSILTDETISDSEIAHQCGVSSLLVENMRIGLKHGR